MEKLLYVIRQISQQPWLIDPSFVESHYPLLRAIAEGRVSEFMQLWQAQANTGAQEPLRLPVAVAGDLENRTFANSLAEAPQGSKSLIRVEGAIMKKDYCGSPGTATLAAQLTAADRHDNIAGHMLILDSPGGTIDGTKAFADVIAQTSKPVVVFVDQLAASAGYWIASAADEIIAINETAMIGSVGTMIRLMDSRKRYEAMGMVEHVINSDKSKDKNRAYNEVFAGNYKPIKEELLNPLNEIFLQAVRSNRPEVDEKALSAKVFLAADAMRMGLIDHIGNFDFALQRLESLIDERAGQVSNISNPAASLAEKPETDMFAKNKFPLLAAMAAILADQQAFSEEQLNDVNQELDKNGVTGYTLVPDTELQSNEDTQAQQTATITGLEQQVAQLTAERDAAEAKAAEFGAKPGANHSQPGNGKGDKIEPTEAELSQEQMDALPHNQEIDNNPLFNK